MDDSTLFLIGSGGIFGLGVLSTIADHFVRQRREKADEAKPYNIRKCTLTIRYLAYSVESYRTGTDDVREFAWTFRGRKNEQSLGTTRCVDWLERWRARGVVPVSADENSLVPWERVLDMTQKVEDVVE